MFKAIRQAVDSALTEEHQHMAHAGGRAISNLKAMDLAQTIKCRRRHTEARRSVGSG